MRRAGFVLLTLNFKNVGRNRWTGECLELGTATHGRTLSQVQRELVELIELHLGALQDAGERERFLAENGVKQYPAGSVPTKVLRPMPVSSTGFAQVRRIALPARVAVYA